MEKPHWIDGVFDDPSKAKETFLNDPRVKDALDAGVRAYHDRKHYLDQNPGRLIRDSRVVVPVASSRG